MENERFEKYRKNFVLETWKLLTALLFVVGDIASRKGKLWNPKPWLKRHVAAAAQTTGPTTWRESIVWAAAAR